jgi:hypothetical protein
VDLVSSGGGGGSQSDDRRGVHGGKLGGARQLESAQDEEHGGLKGRDMQEQPPIMLSDGVCAKQLQTRKNESQLPLP